MTDNNYIAPNSEKAYFDRMINEITDYMLFATWLLIELRIERDELKDKVEVFNRELKEARAVLRRVRPDPPESEEYFT